MANDFDLEEPPFERRVNVGSAEHVQHVQNVDTLPPPPAESVAEPPQDGQTTIDEGDHVWIACCGLWWGDEAWLRPSPIFHFLPTGHEGNCPACHRSLRRHVPMRDDLESFSGRLHETQAGEWVRVGPVTIRPGEQKTIHCGCFEPIALTHFAVQTSVTSSVRIHAVIIGRETVVEGPLPGELFAVRIPTDVKQPIDRGGSLGPIAKTMYQGAGGRVVVENTSSVPIEFLGALFGSPPKPATITMIHSERTGLIPCP